MKQAEKPLLIISRGFSFKPLVVTLLIGVVGIYLVKIYNPSQVLYYLIALLILIILFPLINLFTMRQKILCFQDKLTYASLGIVQSINYTDVVSVNLNSPTALKVIDALSSYSGMMRAASGKEGIVVITGENKKIVFSMLTFKNADIKKLIEFLKQRAPRTSIDQTLIQAISK